MRLPIALPWFVLMLWVVPAIAQTDIHRCIDAKGHALFTDQACAAMQATAVHPAPRAGGETTDTATTATTAATPTEPPPILCAGTYHELRQSVIDAFANRNANRIAGLMLWNGYGSATAIADIRALAALMQQPLLDAGPPDGSDSSSDSSSAAASDAVADPPAGVSELVLHLAGNDASGSPRELRYGIVRRSGCLWLRHID